MATNEEILRSFLVSLDWKNEAAQQKQFVGAIESATLKANLLADGIAAMAKSVAGSIESASQQFLQLGIMADQTRTSISTILSLQQAFVQFGGTAGEANSVLQTINQSMRSLNDGNLSYYQKFGIEQNKVTGQITVDLAKGQQALAGLSDAAVTQFAELAHIPQSVAELIQHHGQEMQIALDKANRTIKAFGINQDVVDTNMRYARALNDIYFDLDQTWTKLTTSIEKPLIPSLEGVDKWLNQNAGKISSSLGEIGAAFKDDVVDPISSIAFQTDRLEDSTTKINNFKNAVIDGLGGIKELLDTVKGVFDTVQSVSDWGNKFFWDLGEKTGVHKLLDPNRGRNDPGTIDFSLPTQPAHSAEVVPLPAPATTGPNLPGLPFTPTPAPQQPFIPSPPVGGDELERQINAQPEPATAPAWFKPWTWGRGKESGPKESDLPSKNATPKAFEDESQGFRIPGEDQSVTLKSGGTAVQSGNPLPVRIEKIDPTASGDLSGIGGGSGDGGGGGGGGGGVGGSLRGSSGRARLSNYLRGEGVSSTESSSVRQPEGDGKYRPAYKLSDRDLSDSVIGTVAGEARTRDSEGVDAVINTMMNRLGTKSYGPSGNLEEVAMARDQFAGHRRATAAEAEFIRSRIRAISSGGISDNTHGATEFRTATYAPFVNRHPEGRNIGGNFFATVAKPGIYGPYGKPHDVAAHLPTPPHTLTPGSSRSAAVPRANIHLPNVYQGGESSEYPAPGEQHSWLGLDKNAKQMMASNWGGDTVHHHYDNSDNSTTHNHNQKVNVTIHGAGDAQETAAAVGSTLNKAFSPSQARQRYLQGAIA